jgi:DNA-3-methyladenine glycosylase II
MSEPLTYRNGAAYSSADAHLARVDAVLADLVRRLGPVTRPATGAPTDLFGALIMAIVRQQLATAAADAIYGRLLAYFGDQVPTPAALLGAGPELRTAAGLSHAKDRALRALAEQVSRGALDLARLPSRPDDEVLQALTAVPGIGGWTAGVFMMFRLDRPDILLAGDLGIRKAAQLAYRLDTLPSPKTLEGIAAPWRPYRTRGCLYLWASLPAAAPPVPVEAGPVAEARPVDGGPADGGPADGGPRDTGSA